VFDINGLGRLGLVRSLYPSGPSGGVFIISAVRTPIGKFGGRLAKVEAAELGACAIRAAVDRAHISDNDVDQVLMGQVLQAGAGLAPARQAMVRARLPYAVSATTINRACGSGLKAIMIGAAAIRAGDAQLVVAGGMESMSRAPYVLRDMRFGSRLGDAVAEDTVLRDALTCSIEGCHVGTHAERVALERRVTRRDQDAFALASHRKAIEAIDAGRFDAEIVPVEVSDRDDRRVLMTTDEAPRRETSAKALGGLRPAFPVPSDVEDAAARPSVTAGNAPGLNDGAAAVVLASERAVVTLGLQPMARLVAYGEGELEARWVFLAPILGINGLLDKAGLAIDSIDLVELNEAFAVQVLADGRDLGFDWSRVNVNGGAIALGHPIGASGARIVATLLHELERRRGRYGLASLCLGGGGSVSALFERVDGGRS
jgi:acetyl-CoA C-acetyltransferase